MKQYVGVYFGRLSFVVAVAMSLFSASCGSRNSQGRDSLQDSLRAEEIAEQKIVRLPDTTFESALSVNYKIETLDTIHDGLIADLSNLYADAPGIFTFRGGPQRDATMQGELAVAPSKIDVVWRFRTDVDKEWGGGSGWTGQPVYVNWPKAQREALKANNQVNSNFKGDEIIVGSLDGNVYFIDPATGNPTREKIFSGNPIKGSVSLDPTLNGLLYVGQGIPHTRPFGAQTIDVIEGKVVDTFDYDPKALRGWGAYDSSAVRVGDFVFRPGENGTLYKWLVKDANPVLHSALRYTVKGAAPGIESSLAVWHNYGYFADNAGNVVCVNLDTLKPVWHYDNHDDSDASPVVVEENNIPYLYTGSEIDRQGEGYGYFVKLNALTGELVWELKVPGRSFALNKKHFDGGFYATPLLGRGNCKNLIFANVVKNTERQNGSLIAIDREKGTIVWDTQLKHYAWSSPIAFMGPDNQMYIFTGDTAGYAYIINAKTGEVITSALVGSNFESSPIVVGNEIYVGSRGDTIFKIKIS